ncbi:MRPS15 family protein [Megaselia abdita]
MSFLNSLKKTATGSNLQLVRNYAFKSDLKIKWVRPEKIPCFYPEKSGDLSKLTPISGTETSLDFKDSRELNTADEDVKALFSLNYQPRFKTSDSYRDQMIRTVQRHELDLGSMEVKLAKMTATIRRFQEHMENYPRDKKIKVELKELIDKRKKFLKYLRRWDYKRFEWVLEKLNLCYKPPPPKYHWITRKESLVKLTDIHCDDLKTSKLENYKESLKNQQIEFLERKVRNLQFIRKEQIACNVPVTVSEEDISRENARIEVLKKERAEVETSQETNLD